MKRKIPITTLHLVQPGSLEGNCTGKQMKRSQASERNHTLKSLVFHLLLLCAVMTASCSSQQSKYDFRNSTEAISACRDYVHALRDLQGCSVSQLTDLVCQWQELSDTVSLYLQGLGILCPYRAVAGFPDSHGQCQDGTFAAYGDTCMVHEGRGTAEDGHVALQERHGTTYRKGKGGILLCWS